MALSADGKYEAGFPELSGEKTTGTWGLIGEQIVLDDNADALLVREEGLFWEGPGVAFAREKPVAADAGKPDKTVTAADFAGFWSSVYVRTESGLAPAADLGEDTDVYVEGNTVVLGGSIFGDTMCTFAYADGAMTWSAGEGAEAVSVRLELTDRGLMLLTMKTGGSEELSLYLTSRDIDWLLGE